MNKKSNRPPLLSEEFENLESWRKEWKGMPEFTQKDLTSFRSIVVHFHSQKDVDDFSKLIGQRITLKQKSLWFPRALIGKYATKRYIDENDKK
jgi:hypothetical protein